MEENDRTFLYAQAVAKELDISTSSLRRWCGAMEKAGYSFERHKDARMFFEKDQELLKQIKQRLEDGQESLETAIYNILHLDPEDHTIGTSASGAKIQLSVDELRQLISSAVQDGVAASNERMIQAMDQKLSDHIEMMDKIKMKQLRQLMDDKQQQIELEKGQNEVVATKEKKPLWKRLLFR